MAVIVVTHTKIIPAGGDGNPNHVQNDDWLANHTVALTAGSIVAADLADAAVTTAKIPDAAITTAKIATKAVTTATVGDNQIGNGQIAVQPANTIKGNNTGSSAQPIDMTAAQARGLLGGCFLGTVIKTGTGSDVLPAGTSVVHLRGIAGGGGGGGAQSSTGVAAAAGGSTGVLLDIWIGTPGTALSSSYTFASGAGGAGGSTSGTSGSSGTDSTTTINGVTYTMKGGGPGGGCLNTTVNATATPTGPAAGTTGGGLSGFDYGKPGLVIAGSAWLAGAGGSTQLGAGGGPVGGSADGLAGTGMGGGGGGGAAQGGVGHVGGAGAAGGFRYEFYS